MGDRSADGGGPGNDEADAATLYGVLEDEVIPAFYDRDGEGIPRRWVQFMRGALAVGLGRYAPTACWRTTSRSCTGP